MPAVAPFLLAQARSRVAPLSNDILYWTVVLAISIVALILAGYLIHRLVMHSMADSNAGPAFDLMELRRLRENGQLTAEEYERAKARLIQVVQGQADGPNGSPAGKASAATASEASSRPPSVPPANPPPPSDPGAEETDPYET